MTSLAPKTQPAQEPGLLDWKEKGRVLAVASIFRDVENLQVELAMERAAQR